jgi:putative hydrolase of the HAD superfamily
MLPWCPARSAAGKSPGVPALSEDGRMTKLSSLTAGLTAVVFDFYGTLTPPTDDEVWAGNVAAVAAALGVEPAGLTAAMAESFGERMTGALGDSAQTLRTLAGRLGATPTDAQVAAAAGLRQQLQTALFTLRPEALPVISQVRAGGLRTGLLSDCTSELPAAWPGLAVSALMDAAVFSCQEGTRKPDPRLFRTVAARLGVSPAECLYVGDGGGNELTGASAVGMRPVLLAGPDWHPHGAVGRETDWSGERISSLTELCADPDQAPVP